MMKKYLLFLSLSVLLSCTNESPKPARELTMEEKAAKIDSDNEDICMTVEPVAGGNPTGRVSFTRLCWTAGKPICIKFLNGSKFKQDMVKRYAEEWTQYANLKFEWVGINDYADIKIAFGWNRDNGNWSEVGSNALNIAQNKPSMNLGSVSEKSYPEQWSKNVLHEFGHALGLGHEHQHPFAPIVWDDINLTYFYYQMKGWGRQTIDEQIIKKYNANDVDSGPFDRRSIMIYSIPTGLLNGDVVIPKNYYLSEGDKDAARVLYPY